MKKKIVSILLSVTMAGMLLAGCGSSAAPQAQAPAEGGDAPAAESAPADAAEADAAADAAADTGAAAGGDNTLTVWAWDQNFNIYSINEAAKIYQRENPDFKLEVEEVSWDDLQTKLGTILGAGNYDQLPDIMLMQDFAFRKYAMQYPDMFTDITNSGIDFSQFAAGKLSASTVDGKNLGIPFDNGAEIACYRSDLLEEAGYTVDDLTNISWTDFNRIGEDVLKKTGYSLFSTQAGSADIIMQMMQSAGASIWNDDGTPNIANNATLKTCMETYKMLFDSGVMATANSWDEYIATFTSGKTLGTINGCWILASVQSAEDQSGKWSMTNMPSLAGVNGATNYSNQGGSSWFITSNCKNVELASDFFAKTFAGSVELYETILPTAGALSTWTPAGDSDVYAQPSEFFGGQAIFKDITDYASKVPQWDMGVYYTEANTALATAVTNVVNGGNIDEELQTAEDTVNFDMGN
ncbi:MAG: extracellular solute-binding protein [Lachnospiraceae bacterium]|nr:extracellular solute-binding protein [Lachnospiraceae bacterium]